MTFVRPISVACALAFVPFAANAGDAVDVTEDPVLVSFDGMQQLVRAANRQRLWSNELVYTLRIDDQGKATDCELGQKFRRKATMIALCRPLIKYHSFEPARDMDGQPVEGTFSATIDFWKWKMGEGFLEPAAAY